MGDLVVQQFVSADGFAANDQNESGRGVFPAGSRTSQLRLIGSETLGVLVAVDYAVESAGH